MNGNFRSLYDHFQPKLTRKDGKNQKTETSNTFHQKHDIKHITMILFQITILYQIPINQRKITQVLNSTDCNNNV